MKKLPTKEIVTALFESYVSASAAHWKLNPKDVNSAKKLSSGDAGKLKFCGEIFTETQKNDLTEAGWRKILGTLAKREPKEKAEESSWGKRIDIFHIKTNPYAYLYETIHAARAYILSQLKDDEDFIAHVNKLKLELGQLEDGVKQAGPKAKVDAATATKIKELKEELADLGEGFKANEKFFDIVKAQDARVKKLGEKTFAEFEANVSSGKRVLDPEIIYTALVAFDPKKAIAPAPKADSMLSVKPTIGLSSSAPLDVKAVVGTGTGASVVVAGAESAPVAASAKAVETKKVAAESFRWAAFLLGRGPKKEAELPKSADTKAPGSAPVAAASASSVVSTPAVEVAKPVELQSIALAVPAVVAAPAPVAMTSTASMLTATGGSEAPKPVAEAPKPVAEAPKPVAEAAPTPVLTAVAPTVAASPKVMAEADKSPAASPNSSPTLPQTGGSLRPQRGRAGRKFLPSLAAAIKRRDEETPLSSPKLGLNK